MTVNKDFKRLVRGRMQKTGEAYTTARRHLLNRQPAPPPTAAPPAALPDYARLAGMSDAAVKAKTGCTWDRWVMALDYANASTWSHRAIAEYVQATYKVQDWWAQAVTVGYERIKGLRQIGQRRNGGFEATKSRTLAVPVEKLYQAFTQARIRNKWLPGIKLTVRTAAPGKSARISWDDGTSVEVWLTRKGKGKGSVAVSHRKLASREQVDERKAYWAGRLDALAELLTPPRGASARA
jgi:uncharacterized protein YndB with AHSA1/START domain